MTVEASTIPGPGKRGGPCRKLHCNGELCERLRSLARVACTVCGEPIGFDSQYVDETGDEDFAPPVFTHALCAARAAVDDGTPPFNP